MKKFNLETISKAYNSGISKKVIERLVNSLADCEGVYGWNLPSQLFDEEPLYTTATEAEEDLEELGVSNCIGLVRSYEQFGFGEFNTEIEPCKIANMVGSIVGEFISNSDYLADNRWEYALTEKDLEFIEDELQTYLESLDEDLFAVEFDQWEFIYEKMARREKSL